MNRRPGESCLASTALARLSNAQRILDDRLAYLELVIVGAQEQSERKPAIIVWKYSTGTGDYC